MKDHVQQMLYLMLGIVVLLMVTGVGLVLVKYGRKVGNDSVATMTNEADYVSRTFLSDLEETTDAVVVPIAVVKTTYYESGNLILDMYDLTHTEDDTVVTNIDDTDLEYDDLNSRSINLLGDLHSFNKVKLGITKNASHTGLYDLYIHDIRCKAPKNHEGTCKTQSENNGAEW